MPPNVCRVLLLPPGYSPFGGGGPSTKSLFNEPKLLVIAARHNVTVSQVILNWQWNVHGITVNPEATSDIYLRENLNFSFFELDNTEIGTLDHYAQQPTSAN